MFKKMITCITCYFTIHSYTTRIDISNNPNTSLSTVYDSESSSIIIKQYTFRTIDQSLQSV